MMMNSTGASYLDAVGRLVSEFDEERVDALDLEREAEDLPQRARLVEFHPDAERRMPGRHGQPLVATAEQSVAGRSFDHSVSVDEKDEYAGHCLPPGVVQNARIRARLGKF